MKKKLFSALLIVLLLALLIPGTVQAAGGLTVSTTSVVVTFPASITISFSAQSNVNITDIRVHYTVERQAHAQVISEAYISFTPAKTVSTQWVWDMRKTGALPMGTSVTYWITVTDASGSVTETLPDVIQFDDNRYDWMTLQEGQVTLKWYSGGESFGNDMMAAAQTALTRLADNTGASLASPVTIYLYASSADLVGALINAQEWVGGIAFSQYGRIAIGVDPMTQLEWGRRTIAHELTHLVSYQVTSNPYNYLPTWLNEGLSMFTEGPLELAFVTALSSAEANNSFITVRSLCSPFPSDYNQAVLSYAESYKIVAYLINEYGRDKMFQMLDAYKQGCGYDEALLKVYGFDIEGLDALWRTTPVAVYGE
jgi:hypothetical protein